MDLEGALCGRVLFNQSTLECRVCQYRHQSRAHKSHTSNSATNHHPRARSAETERDQRLRLIANGPKDWQFGIMLTTLIVT